MLTRVLKKPQKVYLLIYSKIYHEINNFQFCNFAKTLKAKYLENMILFFLQTNDDYSLRATISQKGCQLVWRCLNKVLIFTYLVKNQIWCKFLVTHFYAQYNKSIVLQCLFRQKLTLKMYTHEFLNLSIVPVDVTYQ